MTSRSSRHATPAATTTHRNHSVTQQSLTPGGYVGTPPADFAAAVGRAKDPALTEEQRTAALEEASRIATEQAFDVYLNIAPSTPVYSTRVVGGDTMGRSGYQGIFDLRYVGITTGA